jgi:hypothetical protein
MLRGSLACCALVLVIGCATAPDNSSLEAISAGEIAANTARIVDICETVGSVARLAAFARDAGITLPVINHPIMLQVVIESQHQKLENPAHNYHLFKQACKVSGFEMLPQRIDEMQLERQLQEQIKAGIGI